MYGAIIGDLAGSIYEFDQIQKVHSVSMNQLIEENSFYSDDTILTIAILDAILNQGDYGQYIRKYIHEYLDYKPNFHPYFKTTFSPRLIEWHEKNCQGNSKGNGAMMRISPIGYLFNHEEDILRQSMLATIPSHNSSEAIDAAQTVALIIYYARIGLSKEEIIQKLSKTVNYQEFSHFNTTCSETLSNCLYALFSSSSYEESIRKIISYGGDTDTNACIVGSMAEAFYGLDENLILLTRQKIPSEFLSVLDQGYCKVKNYFQK